jgi:hypothetical protein
MACNKCLDSLSCKNVTRGYIHSEKLGLNESIALRTDEEIVDHLRIQMQHATIPYEVITKVYRLY